MTIGDKVVYIKRSIPKLGLFHNEIYTVAGTTMCGCKDGLCIDIGIKIPDATGIVYCSACGHVLTENGDEYFMAHTGFRLLSNVAEIDELINKCLDYDTA